MISGTDGFGASMREQCLEVAGEYGIEVLADESYGPTDADMTPQLTNIKNTAGVQAVLNPGFGQGPSIVTRNYEQLAVGLPLYQSHGVASKGFIELAGAERGRGRPPAGHRAARRRPLADDDPQKPVVTAYIAEYEARLRRGALDLRRLRPRRLRDPGRRDRPAPARPSRRRSATRSRQTAGLVGTTGVVTMTPEDHLGFDLSAFRMLEIKDGGWTLVE